MLQGSRLRSLLQGLTLLLLSPACQASSLGLTVHVVPLKSHGGEKVHAHFSAIIPGPCPDLTGVCAVGEDCQVLKTSVPFTGTTPGSGWCARQWQKTVPSDYKAAISLGPTTEVYVSIKANPVIRENSGRLNNPPYVGLFPPLRARVNCPHHLHLSVKDLDGDKVQCRFAREDQGECVNCPQHSFIELDEKKCVLRFTGKAAAGQYSIYLMAEDLIPVPKSIKVTDNSPLSSVPVHLSLTVEESATSCSDEPVALGSTPREDTTLFVLPYQLVKFDINYESLLESVSEVAVVGPPELLRVQFKSIGPLATMTMAWVRSENSLTRLLPICFAVNTRRLQSDPRCVWLYQREMRTLPAGTELTCGTTAMTLVLPVSSLNNINMADLQLNSPTCPIAYNSTHLRATIPLAGCGTKTVQSGSELVYTNTLQSVHPFTLVRRTPSLILPLACRIKGVQAKGPQYQIGIPTEKETFGEVRFWLEFYLPGEGPLAKFTRKPVLRVLRRASERTRRDVEPLSVENTSSNTTSSISPTYTTNTTNTNTTTSSPYSPSNGTTSNTTANSTGLTTKMAVGSRINVLDLHVMSNCSIDRAEVLVSDCIESETEDFAVSSPILEQGCTASNSTLEVVTTLPNAKIYRLDLSNGQAKGNTMYIRCKVNLCIATLPSQKCPNMCTRAFTQKTLVDSVYSRSYTITSKPVSLVVTTPPPRVSTVPKPAATTVKTTTTTLAPTTTTSTITTTAAQNTTSHAPEQTSAIAAGVILTTISIYLQNVFLY
ncbi:uncharacterized protein LOC117810388 [Xyrichtys novacula]|uniref:Uncharacterized protein LOC117810388 n=1 Tax=Xyrichtys novacula TaxID=13765 RepID=A0AAV1EKQ8_XYRNO|nr:uncharacterized protein LOC117810388 [Xyrichtys novacula]